MIYYDRNPTSSKKKSWCCGQSPNLDTRGLQHPQCRASEHRAEHSEILQDTGVYSTNRTSNIVRLFAKLVFWHRFHTRAPRVSPVTSFKLSSIAGLQLSLYVVVLLSLMYVVNPVRIGDGGKSGSTCNRVSLRHLGSNRVTSGQTLNKWPEFIIVL